MTSIAPSASGGHPTPTSTKAGIAKEGVIGADGSVRASSLAPKEEPIARFIRMRDVLAAEIANCLVVIEGIEPVVALAQAHEAFERFCRIEQHAGATSPTRGDFLCKEQRDGR